MVRVVEAVGAAFTLMVYPAGVVVVVCQRGTFEGGGGILEILAGREEACM
jgi:hypothetical protein